MRRPLIVLVLFWLLAAGTNSFFRGERPVAAQQETQYTVADQGFVLSNVPAAARGDRAYYDPLETQLVRDGLTSLLPADGQAFDLPSGEQLLWKAVAFDENGAIDRRSLGRGAYVYVPIEADTARVVMLNAASHGGLFVNGIPHTSNLYGYQYYHLPVRLKAGHNGLLLRAGRQGVRIRWYEPSASSFLLAGDQTLPDLLIGQPVDSWGAAIVVNSTAAEISGLSLSIRGEELATVATRLPPIAPLSIRKVGFRIRGPEVAARNHPARATLELSTGAASQPIHALPIELQRKRQTDAHKRTFVSQLDGSVQYYGLRTAVPLDDGDLLPALVLSCHGAAVQASGQAAAYSAKSWLHLVAPTNRRPFGFDWEDLGRADAMEVLELAQHTLRHDPARIYLTGHSMGGHGAWHLGSLFPDRFAAIGPSAGWISYGSYARRRRRGDSGEASAMQELLRRGRIIGDPRQLAVNLRHHAIYILHGRDDRSVPVNQAQQMAELLKGTHTDWVYHEEPGKGHWWSNEFDDGGATCMDWPDMYDYFSRHALPPRRSVRTVEFATANPGVSSTCHWLGIEAQLRQHEVSQATVRTWPNKRRFQGTTENIAVLKLMVDHFTEPGPVHVELDGQQLAEIAFPTGFNALWFCRQDGNWQVCQRPDLSRKGPHRYGATKNELRNRFLFVFGTGGDEQENRWTFAKARLDAETLWYRGNASVDVLADVDFRLDAFPDRTVVVYGNADTNSAWSQLLDNSPVQIHNGLVETGEHRLTGDDLACIFVQPRRDSEVAAVISVAASGLTGLRLVCKQSLFEPFVRYPDCLVLRAPALGSERAVVEWAGYFGLDWSVAGGEFHRPDGPAN